MIPFARADYPFSTYWPSPKGKTDLLTKAIGDVGNWQLLVVLLMMLFNVPIVFHVACPEVTAVQHEYWCLGPTYKFSSKQWKELSTVTDTNFRGVSVVNPCYVKDLPYLTSTYEELRLLVNTTRKRKCNVWEFDKSKTSVLSKFDLACTSLPPNNLAECMFSVGSALGGLVNSYLADRFGRRKLLTSWQIMTVLVGFCLANSSSYKAYLCCRVALGFSCSAIQLCLEVTGGKWRDILSTVYMFSNSFGYITLYLLSQLFTDWVSFQYSITLISIFLLSVWWLVPESPRWLLTSQNLSGLMMVLETASDYNRVTLMPGTATKMKTMPAMRVEHREPNLLMLFRGAATRRLSTVTPFIFFFCSLPYYGLVLNDDLFAFGLVYSGAIEFAAATVVLLLRLKNDVLMVIIANGLSGICCLIGAGLLHHGSYLDIVCMMARFFGGMMNSTLSTIVVAMYPTLIRTTGYGWGNFFVNIAVAVATNIVLLSKIYPQLPMLVLGLSGLLGSISLMYLPGRVARDLLDLAEEVEHGHKEMSRMRGEHPTEEPVPLEWTPAVVEFPE